MRSIGHAAEFVDLEKAIKVCDSISDCAGVSQKNNQKFLLKGTSVARPLDGARAWLKHDAKNIESNTEVKKPLFSALKSNNCSSRLSFIGNI